MRLWSIHPTYLDTKGLVAVWREGLLALHVLQGRTVGYTKHPQLMRFKQQSDPVAAITEYLHCIADEADARNFVFDRKKLAERRLVALLPVTVGQVEYETDHLLKKLQLRDPQRFVHYNEHKQLEVHPLFRVITGEVEPWEKATS